MKIVYEIWILDRNCIKKCHILKNIPIFKIIFIRVGPSKKKKCLKIESYSAAVTFNLVLNGFLKKNLVEVY